MSTPDLNVQDQDLDLALDEDVFKGLALDEEELDPITGTMYKSIDHILQFNEYLGK